MFDTPDFPTDTLRTYVDLTVSASKKVDEVYATILDELKPNQHLLIVVTDKEEFHPECFSVVIQEQYVNIVVITMDAAYLYTPNIFDLSTSSRTTIYEYSEEQKTQPHYNEHVYCIRDTMMDDLMEKCNEKRDLSVTVYFDQEDHSDALPNNGIHISHYESYIFDVTKHDPDIHVPQIVRELRSVLKADTNVMRSRYNKK